MIYQFDNGQNTYTVHITVGMIVIKNVLHHNHLWDHSGTGHKC